METFNSACSSPLCIVCLRNVQKSKKKVDIQLKLFLNLWAEFVGYNHQTDFDLLRNTELFDFCEECSIVASQFCKLLQQQKAIELKLKWKLQNLVNIIQLAGKVPSRMRELKKVLRNTSNVKTEEFQFNEDISSKLNTVKSFRWDILNKSSFRVSANEPKVFVQKLDTINFQSEDNQIPLNHAIENKDIKAEMDPVEPFSDDTTADDDFNHVELETEYEIAETKHITNSNAEPNCFSKGDLANHMTPCTKQELKPVGLSYKCKQCSASFDTPIKLSTHCNQVHFKDKKCPVCKHTFENWANLRRHVQDKHPDTDLFGGCIYKCVTCPRKFVNETKFEKHKITCKQKQQPTKCAECNKVFKNTKNLQEHIHRLHRESSYVCEKCGKAFKEKRSLREHAKYHMGPSHWKFQCKNCGRKFANKYKLESHERTHTKEKPFVCHYCAAKFAHRHNWRNHVKSKHGNEEDGGTPGKSSDGNYLSRKGSRQGECIIAGVSND